jgi:uncharacterized membrane protein
MNSPASKFQQPLSGLCIGAALGAAAMYVFDPDKGRRRRALARDKMRSLVTDSIDLFNVAARDARFRARGVRARTLRLFRRKEIPDDDLVLIERVRARMGRVVSHPHAVQVGARTGRVTLSGPILASEVDSLLKAVRSVPGVSEVDDRLVAHQHAGAIPSLQGNARRPEMRSEIMQENWTPTLRIAALVGGGVLAFYGIRHRTPTALALAAMGLGLTARGASNLPMHRIVGLARGRRGIEIAKTIHIGASPEMVYDMWTDCENFPHFMSHVREVIDLGEGRSHWVVEGPAGAEIEWNAVVTSAVRPELMSWRTEPGALVQHAGTVRFEPDDGGTRVSVKMTYNAAGGVGRILAGLLGSDPRQQMHDDLARMKVFIERGVAPHDAARQERLPKTQPERPALH